MREPTTSLAHQITHYADGRALDARTVPLNSAAPVWHACVVRCRACHESWRAVAEDGADEAALRCPTCGPSLGRVVASRDEEGIWSIVPSVARPPTRSRRL